MELSKKMKKERKGFIFSVDVIIAVTFAIILLVLANYYVRISENSLSNLQIEKIGSDVVALLDHQDILDTLDPTTIKDQMDLLVPINYEMHINVTSNNGVKLSVGDVFPSDKSIISGKRVFVVTQGDAITDHAFLQYWIWLK